MRWEEQEEQEEQEEGEGVIAKITSSSMQIRRQFVVRTMSQWPMKRWSSYSRFYLLELSNRTWLHCIGIGENKNKD